MNARLKTDSSWTEVITSRPRIFDLKLREIWRYRDLCYMYVKKDLSTQYKQTILGPLWFVLQPLLTTLMFTIIFSRFAKISTSGLPPVLFYLSGLIIWNYFSQCLQTNTTVFIDNRKVFGKVYFPRLIVCISIVISNLVKFGIQLILFLVFFFYYDLTIKGIRITDALLLVPLLVFITSGLSLGFSALFSALTTKYWDLKFFLQFGVQLWMYATPIIYPLSNVPAKYKWIIALNPMTGVVTAFKYAFLRVGVLNWYYLLYSMSFMIVLFFISVLIFNRVEKTFMDII